MQGEEQKKLDILANDVLKNALGWAGKLKTIASEEDDTPVATIGSQRQYQERALIDSGSSYIAVSSLFKTSFSFLRDGTMLKLITLSSGRYLIH